MTKSSQDSSLKVYGINELCPSWETWAEKNLTEEKIPAFFERVYASGVNWGVKWRVLLQIWSQKYSVFHTQLWPSGRRNLQRPNDNSMFF